MSLSESASPALLVKIANAMAQEMEKLRAEKADLLALLKDCSFADVGDHTLHATIVAVIAKYEAAQQ